MWAIIPTEVGHPELFKLVVVIQWIACQFELAVDVAHGLAGQLDSLGIVDTLIQNGIRPCGGRHRRVPFFKRVLAGCDGGACGESSTECFW